MKIKKYRYFMCDFETTVYKGQEFTEVWASASVELFTEDVQIFHSIDEQFNYFVKQDCNIVAYYHNLKFDGSFWLSYLMIDKGFKQAYRKTGEAINEVEWLQEKFMENNSFKYSISDKGMWYTIIIKVNNHFIEIRDSLKLLPFSVERIGNSFNTKHKKLRMEYTGFRYAGCEITDSEKKYIGNDVLVVKEALEIMFNDGHDKLTIGSCCLEEYKEICKKSLKNQLEYKEMFPDVYNVSINPTEYTYENAGDYIRKSYRGGWCYLVKGKENQIKTNGTTADVNSLYPSMMSSESGNRYPVGKPCFWKGNYIPDEAIADNKYYFVRVKTRFYIKRDMLPFIQIKSSYLYKGTEALESSDIYDSKTDSYFSFYKDKDGILRDTRVELVLTMTDYQLLKDHYDLVDFEILDGCWFYALTGIFDEYIEKYKHQKLVSKGALRELAKLFLNNLYGKMASSKDSSFKLAYVKGDKTIGFLPVTESNKKPGYIPVGSAITSYARNFTIRAAQANYHGVDNPGFIYADTDSMHCDLPPEEIVGIKVHDKNFCCWKLESCWDKAIFTRQKTYIEHVVAENLDPIEKPYNNIKCAGMPKRCKDLFELSLSGDADINKEWSDEEKEFLFDEDNNPIKRDYSSFKIGLKVPGKLRPKRIRGGVLLVDTSYEMR
nr:MAG: DNA polymerase type B, organellar and viral [Bacteriophage sp.]